MPMRPEEVRDFILSKPGWKVDRWGHIQNEEGTRRWKFGKKALRYEVKVRHKGTEYTKPSNEWIRIASGYYGQMFLKDGRLQGMRKGY